MTLEEAIEHAEKAAKNNEKKAVRCRRHGGYVYEAEARECEKCANEHRQLAEWLKELQAFQKERNHQDGMWEGFVTKGTVPIRGQSPSDGKEKK